MNRSKPEHRPPSRWGEFPPPPPVRATSRTEPLESGQLERIAAMTLMLMVTPLLAMIALGIKIESPRGPVFYRQERVGVDRRRQSAAAFCEERRKTRGFGRSFLIWKFRTMVPDAEAVTGPVWAAERDPRITRVGRVLRNLRLDELPQLMNVAVGEMSLIGPRPERPHFVEKLSGEMPYYERRLSVPPGITGLAQVERKYDESVSDVRTKLKYDLFYVQHRSTLMNVKILIKTVDVVLRGRGAR
ncbi:MAG TPA: sugar transferase [Dongiaceae bacterium]|nr:sugar transferase [Dongiaceae bacterium]